MSQIKKARRFQSRFMVMMTLVLAGGIFAGWQVQARVLGYLAVVGPVNVRFQSPDTNTLAILKAIMHAPVVPIASNTNAVATNMAAPVVKQTEAEADSKEDIGKVATLPPPPAPEIDAVTNQAAGQEVGPGGGEGVNNISGNGPSSAGDLLPVAASMITEYLKPSQSQTATNRADRPGATVFVPLQMGFTPPVQSVPESRAVYKSQ